jgi:titin
MLDARRVTMTGTTAYVAAGLSGMRTIDLSDVNHPNETSWIDTQGGYVNKVIASGKIAYMSCHLDCPYPLQTFDISNPLKPKKIGALKGGSYGRVDGAFRSMSLSNGLLYVAAEQYDLVVNVGKPQAPKAMGWMVVNNVNAAEYGHLMVSVNNDEIQFVDVSNPSALKETAVLERITGGEAVAFLNPRTVAASDGDGIMLIDVSNPHQPLKLGSLAGLGTVMDASVVGTTAYMSSLGAGVKIVDVSNPAKPKLTGTVETPGLAYDSYVHGNLMLVADGYGGLLVYQRGQGQASGADAANALGIVQPAGNTDLQDSGSSLAEPANGFSGLAMSPTTPAFETASPQIASKSCVVSSNADKGSGSLRACLAGATEGTTITFDRSVFPPSKPKIIKLASPLPQIVLNHFTIDASNAGVILDGSQLKSGSGLYIFASYDKIMGLQIVHFPENGIKLQGDFNQIGGNRLTGSAPTGQGNLLSQNALNGVIIWGKKNVVIGNLVGTDVTGSRSLPNQYGVFVSEYGVDTTVGGLKSGEGNLMSGNSSANLDTWGLRTKVIGNVVGLNLQGNRALTPASHSDVIMESGATDNVIGGTVSAARNVISGADFGVIFSDPNTYQNSVIGNYIGTDITGTRAVPNTNGVVIFMTNHNRLGGSAPGEGNLISGNTRGVDLNGYGVSDNIILGNKFGLDSAGRATLPNNIGVSIDTGQTHDAIGGLTRAEGNVFAGGQAAVWISDPGIEYHYVAGNVISNTTVAGIYIGGGASNNFVEGNSISEASSPGIRVDVGTGNRLRANSYNMAPAQAIELEYGGNGGLAAPVIQSATSGVVGTACAGCVVEVYGVTGTKIVYAGEAKADGSGAFQFGACEAIAGKDVVALAIDGLGNTSAFSVELKAAGSG